MTLYIQSDGDVYEGSSKEFYRLTEAQWIATLRFPEGIEQLGTYSCSQSDQEWMHLLIPRYRMYQRSPPKLCIRQGISKGRHSVHAVESITKGTVVTEYLGEWAASASSQSSYRWGPIDELRFRNYGGMIEDGFPNVAPFYLYQIDNSPLRVLFVALEDIAAGEMIAIHYGMNHSVKVYYHEEYRLRQLISFFSVNSLERVLRRLNQLRVQSPRELGWKQGLELENLVAKLRYLYQTPSALMHILLNNIINPESAFLHINEADFRYYLLNFPFHPNPRQQEVQRYLLRMQEYFACKSVDTSSVLRLLAALRQRVFFETYLQQILNGVQPSMAEIQAFLWNKALDAVAREDRQDLQLLLAQTKERKRLIRDCLIYAKELQSPLLPWLQHLVDPPLPLDPTG